MIIEYCYTQNIMVSEKKTFVCFSDCTYMGANVPWGRAILNPRGMIGRIYVKQHIILYKLWDLWFQRYVSYYKRMTDNDVPGEWPV